MTDWTIEQFENAVKEAVEEKLNKEKTAHETLEKLKEDLILACKKFVNDVEVPLEISDLKKYQLFGIIYLWNLLELVCIES